MSEVKLSAALLALSPWEKKRFRKFLRSPYLITDARLSCLYDFLDESEVNREAAFAHVFPGEPYDYFRISNVFSYLEKALERFWAYEQLRDQPEQEGFWALKGASVRDLGKSYRHLNRQIVKKWDREGFRNEDWFFRQYQLAALQDDHFLRGDKREANDRLDGKLAAADLFYVSAMLKNLCAWINRRNIVQTQSGLGPYARFLDFIQTHIEEYQDHPYIQLYYLVLMTLLEGENPTYFQTLKELVPVYASAYPKEEQKALYAYLQNYCINRINSGNTHYLAELFGLYQSTIEQQIICDDRSISQWDFKNIVSLGLRLKEFDWTESFIRDFHQKLPPALRKYALDYNLAAFYYEQGQSTEALKLLVRIDPTDLYYDLGVRTLMMKIYFDQEEEEALEALIHSFGNYLRRHKRIADYQVKVHLNLIRFVRKASRLRGRMRSALRKSFTSEVEQLLNAIRKTGEITNINWLESRVKSLTTEAG